MKSRLSRLFLGAHGDMWRIGAAVVAATFMLFITEMAYQSQSNRLSTLAKMGKARLSLTYAMQRITDAESGKRGYLLVGGQDYLEPYVRASNDVRVALREIHSLDHGSGEASLPPMQLKMDLLFEEKLAEMQEVLRRHDSGNREAALDMVRSGIGREIMQRMRLAFDANMAHRNQLIADGLVEIQELLLLGRIGIAAMTVLSLLILVLLIRQGRQLMSEREAQRKALLHEKDRLEQEVQRRTSDLRDLARHLQTAREDERARLARDLHDELGALLTTAKLDVAVLRPRIQQNMPEMLSKISHLTDALNQGIALKRRIIEDLCPYSLRTLGLAASLEALLHDTAKVSGLKIEQELHCVHLSADDQLTVYRVVQEALTNTLKYAQAQHVRVRLLAQGDRAVASIEDDGIGFDPETSRLGRHGLRGMHFRVEASGGELSLTSAPGQGTCIVARLPMQAAAEPVACLTPQGSA